MLKVGKQSKTAKSTPLNNISLVLLGITLALFFGFVYLWANGPYLRMKFKDAFFGPPPPKAVAYDSQKALEAIAMHPPLPTERRVYSTDEILQRLSSPVTGECVECFDRNNASNGPDQFYRAARVRFHQQKIEEGLEYLELAGQHGHPVSIHNLALIYDEGYFGKKNHKRAYLYFKLLSIYADKFEHRALSERSEESLLRLESHLSNEDFEWIEAQVKKLNIHT